MTYADFNASFARQNHFRDGLPAAPFAGLNPTSPAFFEATRRFQAQHGLKADGYFGEKTFARYLELEGDPVSPTALLWCGMQLEAPAGVELRNWHHEAGFGRASHSERWDKPVDTVLIHESVTRSVEDTIAALNSEREYRTKRGELRKYRCGVHLLVAPDGVVYQTADIADDSPNHCAGGYNKRSIAIEVVNPYKPAYLEGHDLPWKDVLQNAPWASGDAYVVPTLEQCRVLVGLLEHLSTVRCGRVQLGSMRERKTWPAALSEKSFALWRVQGGPAGELRGVLAHHHAIDHSDGAFPALVAYLALVRGLEVEEARAKAIELANGAKRSVEV